MKWILVLLAFPLAVAQHPFQRARPLDRDEDDADLWVRLFHDNSSLSLAPTSAPSLRGNLETPFPVNIPVALPVAVPVSAPTNAPVNPPVSTPTDAPVDPTPTDAPVSPPVGVPVTQPVNVPVVTPTGAPVSPPVAVPVSVPTDAPVNSPTNAPVSPPVPVPVPTVVAPVNPPTDAPVNPPTDSPVNPTPTTPFPTTEPTAMPTCECVCPAPVPCPDPVCPTPAPTEFFTPSPVAPPPPVVTPPAPTLPPSMAPVATPPAIPLGSSDTCAQALQIAINGDPILGSTVNATTELFANDVVYFFVGNGRKVRVSTCSEETTTSHNFLVRNNGCNGGGLGEVVTDTKCPGILAAAGFEFDTVMNRVYPIVVFPRTLGATGQFALFVTDFVNPPNDVCNQAQELEVNGPAVSGTTINATQELVADDVVYFFIGNGRKMRVSTCTDETTTAHNFLVRNNGCNGGGLGEVVTDPKCPSNIRAAGFEFDTVAGRTYPVVVYPRTADATGNFAIFVSDFVNPANDYCDQAIQLQIGGDPVIGSTVNATRQLFDDDVVYSFVGNGRKVRVSTCFDETTTAHNFLVRNNGCNGGGLGEVVTDTECPGNIRAAGFEFDTVAGRVYPVVVYPRSSGMTGQFAIQVVLIPDESG